MKKLLILQAIKDEAFEWNPAQVDVCYVYGGIGKARTAMALTEAIIREQPDAVLNVGTAGTFSHNVGDILVCDRFVDRDLSGLAEYGVVSSLESDGAEARALPFATVISSRRAAQRFTVSTGDTFVTDTGAGHPSADAVDMEAFAAAMVCSHFDLPFLSVKYITDVIGSNSVKLWEERLADARRSLTAYFATYNDLTF